MNWQKILSKMSPLGLLLLLAGAALCFAAPKACRRQGLVLPLKAAGLALALAGAVILLDVIPGM